MPGHGQSGRFFYHKTTRLVEALHEIALDRDAKRCSERIELFYVNGPLSAGQGPESDVWTWGQGDFEAERRIWGLDASINKIMDILAKHGPFDGIIGFSTGATVAAIITSLLEGNRKARLDIKQVCRNKNILLGRLLTEKICRYDTRLSDSQCVLVASCCGTQTTERSTTPRSEHQ